MLKLFSRIPNLDVYILTKSHPEQFSNSRIKTKEIGEEIKHLNEYEDAIIVFDDILGTSNCKHIDQFFRRGRHIKFEMFYLSQSYIDLRKGSIMTKSNKIILFNQTIKGIENIFRDGGEYDMSYDENKQLCRKSWEE